MFRGDTTIHVNRMYKATLHAPFVLHRLQRDRAQLEFIQDLFSGQGVAPGRTSPCCQYGPNPAMTLPGVTSLPAFPTAAEAMEATTATAD